MVENVFTEMKFKFVEYYESRHIEERKLGCYKSEYILYLQNIVSH